MRPNVSCRALRFFSLLALLAPSAVSHAQGTSVPPAASTAPVAAERSIEDLNLLGAAVSNPPFTDTVLGADSGFRRALFERGMLLRANVVPRFTMNLLDGPVPESEQRYIGHRPTFIWGLNPVFVADLRQLHLQHAQLNVGFAWKWATWAPAGPNATTVSTLNFFQRWGDRRVEMKAGYNINDQEFVGLQVGGSSSTGAQGVYAVLPNEVGMSYYPLMAPSVNFRFKGPGRTYYKTAAQRSLDAAGGSPRSTATRPAWSSCRTATACCSSTRLASSARRAPPRARRGFAPATCATARCTRTRGPASRRAGTTARMPWWTTNCARPIQVAPARASTWAAAR